MASMERENRLSIARGQEGIISKTSLQILMIVNLAILNQYTAMVRAKWLARTRKIDYREPSMAECNSPRTASCTNLSRPYARPVRASVGQCASHGSRLEGTTITQQTCDATHALWSATTGHEHGGEVRRTSLTDSDEVFLTNR
jgi:hypothetical protein